jgi:hypothetical protein
MTECFAVRTKPRSFNTTMPISTRSIYKEIMSLAPCLHNQTQLASASHVRMDKLQSIITAVQIR